MKLLQTSNPHLNKTKTEQIDDFETKQAGALGIFCH